MRMLSFAMVALISAISFAQQPGDIPLDDIQSRNAINDALPNWLQMDDVFTYAKSYVVKMETTETLGSRVDRYVSFLSLFDDQSDAHETLQSEMLTYFVNPSDGSLTLRQRIVADSWRVWAFDPIRNEYSVSYYSNRNGARPKGYRQDFLNLFKSPVQGHPGNLLTLMNQLSTGINPILKDWIGGVSFQGWERPDPGSSYRTVWQQTPDGNRNSTFFMRQIDGIWGIDRIEINNQVIIAGIPKLTQCVIRQVFSDGIPMKMPMDDVRFQFMPPLSAKIIASPRVISF